MSKDFFSSNLNLLSDVFIFQDKNKESNGNKTGKKVRESKMERNKKKINEREKEVRSLVD